MGEKSRELSDLLVLPRPAEILPSGARFSEKTLTNWACRKGKSGLGAKK